MDPAESGISERPSEKLVKVDNTDDIASNKNGSKEHDKEGEAVSAAAAAAAKPKPKSDAATVCPIQLNVDNYGTYVDEHLQVHTIKRYTWKNQNNIQVAVITYGARVQSIKLPDKNGFIEDVLLGFDDFAGYYHYNKYYIGATIGRVVDTVRDSTFVIDGKQFWLNPNKNQHHFNGGTYSFDKAVWTPYVDGKRLILSYISPHNSDGYPGHLLVRVMYELSGKNEFKINMEAECTQPTIINMSNQLYFNLAGHHKGPDEIYRHILTLNCNCYTPMKNGFPTGIIQSVAHTQFDFQVPKLLGKVMGVVPKDGFNQNLCVNRGMEQGDCFVARVMHPPSGRLIEIYSNQPGVNFTTANEFGYGDVLTLQEILKSGIEANEGASSELGLMMQCLLGVYEDMQAVFKEDYQRDFDAIINLIIKIKTQTFTDEGVKELNIIINPLQFKYLKYILDMTCDEERDAIFGEMKRTVRKIITAAKVQTELGTFVKNKYSSLENESKVEPESVATPPIEKPAGSRMVIPQGSITAGSKHQVNPGSIAQISKSLITKSSNQFFVKPKSNISMENVKQSINTPSIDKSKTASHVETKNSSVEDFNVPKNIIPNYYKESKKILGKRGAVYRMHSGIALQTQNYPGCANFKHFPECVLRPGQIYKHSVTYKFWIRAGNPNKWIKRNQ